MIKLLTMLKNYTLQYYNQVSQQKRLKEKMSKESKLVKANSLEILEEFEMFEESIQE